MKHRAILVTGATGKTGSRVASLLEARNVLVRRASRRTNPGFDWSNRETFADAVCGCHSAYICYYPDYAFPGATAALTAFTETAARAGVEHIVMLVGRGEKHARAAEVTVRRAGIPTTVLRSAWFAQNFSEGAMLPAVHDGVIAMPGGNIREPVIDIDDLCEVASRMLVAAPGDRTLELTGPEALTFAEMAAQLSREIQRPISHRDISFEEFHEELRSVSDSDYARIVTDIAEETLDGRNEATSSDVEMTLGRRARSFSDFARRAVIAGAWTR